MFGIVATCYAVYSTMLLADFSIGDRDFNVSGVQRGQFVPVKVLVLHLSYHCYFSESKLSFTFYRKI